LLEQHRATLERLATEPAECGEIDGDAIERIVAS